MASFEWRSRKVDFSSNSSYYEENTCCGCWGSQFSSWSFRTKVFWQPNKKHTIAFFSPFWAGVVAISLQNMKFKKLSSVHWCLAPMYDTVSKQYCLKINFYKFNYRACWIRKKCKEKNAKNVNMKEFAAASDRKSTKIHNVEELPFHCWYTLQFFLETFS